MNKKEKELPVFSVILFFAAIATAAGATVMAYEVITYIIDIGIGRLSLTEIVFMCMESVFIYYILALLLGAASVIMQNTATAAAKAKPIIKEIVIKDESE